MTPAAETQRFLIAVGCAVRTNAGNLPVDLGAHGASYDPVQDGWIVVRMK